ncbi:proline-rich receptor-like protein kinase PERK7 [Ananas comosus]|uniref:Proline-rich receptor-like protein kinase PERK7 n=1 Tax=Ananas comosus TaxID=4615 RepID=A0A6P5GTT7_ANACO|nr:proline-rich receptor-like protein kinase PERK7 [Ananas comosus]
MDESFRRAGSIPFKWEIQPGVPKPYPSSPSPSPKPPPHPPKLTPPPPSKKTNHSYNPSPPSFSSPWLPPPPSQLSRDLRDPSPASTPPFFRRSSSASPSKRRPTSKAVHASMDSPRQRLVTTPVSQGCFVMPSLRRKEEKKSFVGGGGGGKINYIAFRSPRRSVSARSLPLYYAPPSYNFASSSSSSSSSSTPSRKKDGRERDEMTVASGWMI